MVASILLGGDGEAALEFPGEGGVVSEAALVAKLCNGGVGGGEEGLGKQEALAVDVLVDAVAGICLELAHHVELAGIALLCQGIYGQLLREMAVDILQNPLDSLIVGHILQLLQPLH